MMRDARACREDAPASTAGARDFPANSMPAGHWRTVGPTGALEAHGRLGPQEDLIDAIADIDVADAGAARRLHLKVFPGNAPMVLVQYRDLIGSGREFAGIRHSHPRYGHIATNVRSGVVTVQPSGAIGLIAIRLKPEAAPRFLHGSMGAFANAKIGLADMLKRHAVCTLEDQVAQARTSAERVALVTHFLHKHLRQSDPDPLVSHAAKHLRVSPTLRIGPLARELGISERGFSRRFRAVFGVSPKEFARSARLEQVLAARASGLAWADVSCACGFTDQAHMINDTRAILGASPERVLRAGAPGQTNGPSAAGQTSLLFW